MTSNTILGLRTVIYPALDGGREALVPGGPRCWIALWAVRLLLRGPASADR